MARPPRCRRRRESDESRELIWRARARDILSRALFGIAHPAVALAIEHVGSLENFETARHRADFLLRFLDWCHHQSYDPFQLRRLQAKAYYASLPASLARSTRHKQMSAIRSWYIDANEAGLCGSAPFYRVGPHNIDPRHPTEVISFDQVDRMVSIGAARVARSQATPAQERNEVAVYAMTRVGPRRFEAAGGHWSDLVRRGDVTQWEIHGKGDEDERTTLPADVVEKLDAWKVRLAQIIGRAVQPDDALFPVLGKGAEAIKLYAASGPLETLRPATLGKIYKDALDDADIGFDGRPYGAHVARATSATLAYRSGATDREIQRMLRHKLLATTHRYIRLAEDTTSPAETWQPNRIDFPNLGQDSAGASQ